MSEWTRYCTDRLFLLVGTNPLPNYVAALLLAKDDSTVHLLHSGGEHGTAGVAARLKQAIQKRRPQGKEPVLREIDEADGSRIAQKMGEILQNIEGQASVGLHYTGGTKAMAVHVYRDAEKKFPDSVFSYLDARTLSLRVDKQGEGQTKIISVEQACEVKLDELIALHGRSLKPFEKETCLEQTYCILANLHSTHAEVWREWCNKNLRREKRPDKFKSKTELAAVSLSVYDPLLTDLMTNWGCPATLGDIPRPDGWDIEKLAKWLDGLWLEHHVLDCVKQVATDSHVHDFGMGLKTIPGQQEFEFDVAAMRGYQLFALSCTTDFKKERCKEKLFEAYIRARQMGGDEARVALVCCYEDALRLQGEIEEAWFTEGRVRVFGRQNLSNLPVCLKEWFETANSAR